MKNATSSSINLEGAVVSFSNFVLSSNREEGTNVDVTILKFPEMLRFFPQFYADGEREAFRKHKAIQVTMRKEMDHSRSLDTKQGKTVQDEEDQDVDDSKASDATTAAANSGEQPASVLMLTRRRQRNNVDLCELEMIPSKMQVMTPVVTIRPTPLKVNVIN